jgi:hypothetical protein
MRKTSRSPIWKERCQMAKTTKRAKRTPRRADAADETWAKRVGILLYARELQTAEDLARRIGPEGIAKRRLNHARDDEKFQAFMAYYVRPSRPL